MTWKDWLGYGIYKKLWSIIGGRPWTFISRDVWHKLEFFPIVGIAIINYYASRYIPEGWYWVILASFTIGYICGHFFWGRQYVPNQQGK